MVKNNDQFNDKNLSGWELIKVNLELGISKAFLVFPTQWMQVAMRRQQTALIDEKNSRVLTWRQALTDIAPDAKRVIKEPVAVMKDMQAAGRRAALLSPKNSIGAYAQGFLKAGPLYSLFKGSLPSAGKEALKNGVYKGAVIVKAPRFADYILASTPLTKANAPAIYNITQASIAGSIAAATDVILGGTLDSWATQAATSHGKNAQASYTQDVLNEKSLVKKIQRAYRGFVPAMVKSSMAFTTMYGTKGPIKEFVANQFGDKKQQYPGWVTLSEVAMSGTAVALVSSVPDIVKTWKQMPNPSQLPLREAIIANYKKHGWRGMVAGVPLKSVMVISGWGLTYFVTQTGGLLSSVKNQASATKTPAVLSNPASFYRASVATLQATDSEAVSEDKEQALDNSVRLPIFPGGSIPRPRV